MASAFYFIYMYSKIASAIINDIYSGLRGVSSNISLSIEQLEDEIVSTRLLVLEELKAKGMFNWKELLVAVNCIAVDCKSLERCPCPKRFGTPNAHFEIPQVFGDYIYYLGAADRLLAFNWQVSSSFQTPLYTYKKRKSNAPFVYIDPTPNENNKYDCFVFNAPLLKEVSIVAVFKDLRQVEELTGCAEEELDTMSYVDNLVKQMLTELKIKYYRQLAYPILPNTQQPK